jgi:hypothetical protein
MAAKKKEPEVRYVKVKNIICNPEAGGFIRVHYRKVLFEQELDHVLYDIEVDNLVKAKYLQVVAESTGPEPKATREEIGFVLDGTGTGTGTLPDEYAFLAEKAYSEAREAAYIQKR